VVPDRNSWRGWEQSFVFGNKAILKRSLLKAVPISAYETLKPFRFRLDFAPGRYFYLRSCVPACHWSGGAATLSACRDPIADYSRGPLPGQIV
jgi:hypothetical protein